VLFDVAPELLRGLRVNLRLRQVSEHAERELARRLPAAANDEQHFGVVAAAGSERHADHLEQRRLLQCGG
jgi:hypothetical protein